MKTRLCLLLYVLPLLSWGQQNAYVSPAGTKFLLYTPPSYSTSTDPLPLLVSLHGKGEWGTDITKLTSGNTTGMPSRLIYLNQWPATNNFIVLTPQYNPPNVNDPFPIWPPTHIDEVINYVLANWRIKSYRVYITGLSLGANATWNYTAAYPQKVAAIVPIGGRADLTKACLLKDIPAWVFHGDEDMTNNVAYSQDMVNAINNCQPPGTFNRKFNILYTKAHEGWNEIYNGTNGYRVFDWMMKFTKGSTANVTPYISAGPDLIFKVGTNTVSIIGDAFDSRGTITDLTWTQVAGTALTLTNTHNATLRISNLQAGTFEFQLTATDNLGAQVSDRMLVRVYGATSLPVMTRLVLVNGETNADVQNLSDGMIIDKNLLNLNQINIRAEATGTYGSIRFSVNTNRNTRTVNSPGPYMIKAPHATNPEWQIRPGEYVICAAPYTGTGGTGSRGVSQCFRITVTEGVPMAGCEGAGKIYREVWPGVPGQLVTDIPLTTAPAVLGELYSFESPTGETGIGDNYGARIRGYICPPATGNYTFWIASDDRSELWLSTNANPANKARICFVSGYTTSRQWTKYASQKSALIPLQAGTKYYIEALHKEATLADNLAVGWQLPNGTLQRPIPGIRLIPFSGSSGTANELLTEVTSLDAVSVYPNPVRRSESIVHLVGLKNQRQSKLQIQVTSLTGEKVKSIELDCDDSCEDILIEFEKTLSPGVYIIHANTAQGRIVRKFIAY